VKDPNPLSAPGPRTNVSLNLPQSSSQPASQANLGIFTMLLTGGLVGLALAALRLCSRGTTITLADYRRLEPHMSYETVCLVLGRRGDDISVAPSGKLYAWRNRDGSRLAGLFQDNKLVRFGANGLK
jgi:hypothetical protein